MDSSCPFCHPKRSIIVSNEFCYAIYDKFPVSPGHALIVPFRHIADYYDLSPEEQSAVWELAGQVRQLLMEKHRPAGLNTGINSGAAAGQTIFHAHVHLIPRYEGDVEDPTGGVRGVIPDMRFYHGDREGTEEHGE